MPAPAASTDHGIVVLAPLGRDAFVVTQTLAASGVACTTVATIAEVVTHVRQGLGAVLLTEEALTPTGATELLAALSEQPAWSDLPVLLLLAAEHGGGSLTAPDVAAVASLRNVTILQRPLPAVTLRTAVQASLRARRRQYEVRDLLARERIAREQAEAATRIKDEFLVTVSHELRTPLSGILIWSQLLAAGRLTGDQAVQAMQAIVTNATAQSKLIEDLLDVSRMHMGKLRLDVQPRALGPLVRAAVEVLRPMADAKGVRIATHLAPTADVVLADPDRIQQIFCNLIANGVKFTPSGGLVSLRLTSEPGAITVTVTDTGEGISPEFLPHVFGRFRQADQGSTRRHGGLGLGLPIVQQLVELHGGTIEAASAGRDHGASFAVRLPVVTAARRAPADHPEPGSAGASLTGVRVLLVDDDSEMQLALTLLLEDAGADVIAVDGPAAALAILGDGGSGPRPHVLVSDLQTPDDGHALVRAVRSGELGSGEPPLPAIAMSARAGEADHRRALEAGFQIHLPTPVPAGALPSTIRALLARPAS